MGEWVQDKLPRCRGSTVNGCGHRIFFFKQVKSKANLCKEETQIQEASGIGVMRILPLREAGMVKQDQSKSPYEVIRTLLGPRFFPSPIKQDSFILEHKATLWSKETEKEDLRERTLGFTEAGATG